MAEIADGLINGEFDCVTGEYLGEPTGFPRTTEPNHPNSIKPNKYLLQGQAKSRHLNGVCKFLRMNGVEHDHEAIEIIRGYCEEHLEFAGTLNECAKEIQDNFSHFSRQVRRVYT